MGPDVSEDSLGAGVRRRDSGGAAVPAALEETVRQADSDPRAFQAVLTCLETDPRPGIRHAAAWWLLTRADQERSRQALRAAAIEDEDVQVRWAARYASRLAERQTSTHAAGPASG
jgi:hypothetical protein